MKKKAFWVEKGGQTLIWPEVCGATLDLVLLFVIQWDGFQVTSVFKVSIAGFVLEPSICAAKVSMVDCGLNLMLCRSLGTNLYSWSQNNTYRYL